MPSRLDGAHYLAGNGSFSLRPRHLERPKTFHFILTDLLPLVTTASGWHRARGDKGCGEEIWSSDKTVLLEKKQWMGSRTGSPLNTDAYVHT